MTEPMRDPTLPPEMQTRLGDGWVTLPGMDGIPFRTRSSEIPTIKEDDPEYRRPQVVDDIHVKTFDTTNEEDMEEYTKVLNLCARGNARIVDRHVEYDEDLKGWRVFLTWSQLFLENPAETGEETRKMYT